ncbi:MAG: RIP metalloprotease RseP [Anaerolineae bacterium]|jgi:regulator of sigma E protease
MIGPIAFIVIFSLLIFAHELGHFLAAKLSGVDVQEFGFGYPPRLARLGSWRGTEITLNVLPFGGFVRMSEDDPTVRGSLAGKRRSVRALVYAAGALMNVVLAVVLYSTTFMVGALTPVEAPGAGIYYVAPNSPAEEIGLLPGDTIVAIDGERMDDIETVVERIRARAGEEIEIVVSRNGRELAPFTVVPRTDPPENEGALGVALDLPLERRTYPVWEAVPLGIRTTYNSVRMLFIGIQSAIRGQVPFQVTGPIGIYQTTVEVARTGIERLLEFTAFLSLNLFLVNLLPLPALDGGRLIFVGLEWVRGGKRVPPEKEGVVHAIGMVLLIALMIVVTFADYLRYFG